MPYLVITDVIYQNLIDNLLQLLQIKLVSESVCKSLINIFLNESIYYLNLSRGVNFRPEDNSSVLKDKNYKLFIKNLTKKEATKWLAKFHAASTSMVDRDRALSIAAIEIETKLVSTNSLILSIFLYFLKPV